MSTTTTQRRQSIDQEASSSKDGSGIPSGFVLKLFQMVNGAPDDIISVSHPVTFHVILRKKISLCFL
jgi:hypothetical protein